MRYLKIRRGARLLDRLIDEYRKLRGLKTFPHKLVTAVAPFIFDQWRPEGRGAFKTVLRVSSNKKKLALKTANTKHIRRDADAYNRLPPGRRNRYYAKIYWKTKYCLLQKYGKKKRVPRAEMRQLRKVARRHGLTDVRPANVRCISGCFKIVDANLSRRKR